MSGAEGPPLEPGDLVAVSLPPSAGWLDLVRAAWEVGAALLPVDHRLPRPQTRTLLRRARPTVVVSPDGWERPPDGIPAEPDVALVISTSGTAGEPKLVQLGRGGVDAAVAASAHALEATPHDRWLCCLPLAHVGGLLVLLRGALLGAPVSVHERFDPRAVAAEPGVAFTSVVPTMLVRLLDAGGDLSRFRAILVGGGHLAPALRDRADRAHARVVETFGLTESCGGVVYDGRALPGVRVRLDVDGGIELGGPTLMVGYRFDTEATGRAFTPDGWLRTGDAGEIDADGRLHVVGRADDLIRSGGEKVWPQQIEAVLRAHPKVQDVLVGPRPDPEWGQRVVAWVVPRRSADPPTLEELRAFVGTRLPRHTAPRELVLVEALPRTGPGKVRRSALRALE